jgi:hypothetical protein
MKDDYTSSAKIIYNKAADLCICVSIYLSPKPNKSWIIAPIIFNSYQRCINQNARKSRSYAEHTLFLLKRNCVGHTNNTSKPIILVEQSSMGSKFTHIRSIEVFCSSRNNGSELHKIPESISADYTSSFSSYSNQSHVGYTTVLAAFDN